MREKLALGPGAKVIIRVDFSSVCLARAPARRVLGLLGCPIGLQLKEVGL